MVASFAMASSKMILDRLVPSGGTLGCTLSEGIFVSFIPVFLAPSLRYSRASLVDSLTHLMGSFQGMYCLFLLVPENGPH